MTDLEPGHLYSGVVYGERYTLMRGGIDSANYYWTDGHHFYDEEEVTDVRGPLVVLDLHEVDVEYAVKMMRDCGCDVNVIAAQIEEQTRPSRQIGWHEVESHSVKGIRRWDGRMWSYSTGPLDDFQGWTSTHYIGPAKEDS